MDVHPTKNVSIGIDPYPYHGFLLFCLDFSRRPLQQFWELLGVPFGSASLEVSEKSTLKAMNSHEEPYYIAKLVYNSNNYGLWYANNYS